MPKTYVGDAMKLMQSELMFELLQNPKTHIYVCGDASIANNATDACVAVLCANGMSRAKAVRHMQLLKADGRQHLDVWGAVVGLERNRSEMRKRKLQAAKLWLRALRDSKAMLRRWSDASDSGSESVE